MLLIYTHKITPRFSFTMRQVCGNILGLDIDFTTKVEDFIKHKGPKITYTKQPLQNEFFIRSNDLLFEQGINDIAIHVDEWDDVPCFFRAGDRSNVPFDIFAASFYLLSRYEEYLPHVKDELGRFPAKESIAHQNGFLKLPVVDLWAYKFGHLLSERFPEINPPKRSYSFTSIINVTTSHNYAHRGVARTLGGLLLDLVSFRLRALFRRLGVLFGFRKDPYDNFMELVEIHKKFRAKTLFFFQFAKYSVHNKNVSPLNNKFRYLIKSVADYSIVSLSASHEASLEHQKLVEEKKSLSELINRPVNYSRLRYNRVNIPVTYRNVIDAEFTDDYTMGYSSEIGFRAGTCTPFYFYDITLEVRQPLRMHPFVVYDYALHDFKKKDQIFDEIDPIYRTVKRVNGHFTTVFSNELLGSKHRINWLELYEAFLKRYYV
ncbi:polysaccharide deacetylase family protein [Allomuricauda sp. d1]|uniref:polysaccharide deacetylase family protein n=1 Tax=Allomuricauda sp. d1 TaxID=3136725 RepID=UPI0031D50927